MVAVLECVWAVAKVAGLAGRLAAKWVSCWVEKWVAWLAVSLVDQ